MSHLANIPNVDPRTTQGEHILRRDTCACVQHTLCVRNISTVSLAVRDNEILHNQDRVQNWQGSKPTTC